MNSISIVIPTYNREKLLQRTLDSIIAQTNPNWECIVVDDHSTDNTMDLLQEYHDKDSRIRFAKNTHRKGAPGARNTGLELTKNDWVMFFDSDNLMYDNLIETVMKNSDDEHDVFVWFSNVISSDTGCKVSEFCPVCTDGFAEDIWAERCYVDTNNAVIRKTKLQQIGGWDECCPSMEEWDLHIRLSSIARYKTIPHALLDYFTGRSDSISTDLMKGVSCRLYLLKKHGKNWIKHLEAGVLNYTEVLNITKKIGSCSFGIKTRLRLLLVAPKLSLIVGKRKLKSFAHAK